MAAFVPSVCLNGAALNRLQQADLCVQHGAVPLADRRDHDEIANPRLQTERPRACPSRRTPFTLSPPLVVVPHKLPAPIPCSKRQFGFGRKLLRHFTVIPQLQHVPRIDRRLFVAEMTLPDYEARLHPGHECERRVRMTPSSRWRHVSTQRVIVVAPDAYCARSRQQRRDFGEGVPVFECIARVAKVHHLVDLAGMKLRQCPFQFRDMTMNVCDQTQSHGRSARSANPRPQANSNCPPPSMHYTTGLCRSGVSATLDLHRMHRRNW
jgi:hypothetical protein